MVYTLDKSYLRPSATGFDQFHEDARGLAMMKSFSFFVKMVYEMQQGGHQEEGQNMAVFFEWVKHASSDKHVAIRLHVFSNRLGKGCDPVSIIRQIVDDNKQRIACAQKRKSKKAIKEDEHVFQYDSCLSVASLSEYARQVADVYTRNHEASCSLDNPNVNTTNHSMNPHNQSNK